MAQPTVFRYGAGTFWLSDGAVAPLFTKLCGFTSMELTVDKDTNDSTIPDCEDPDAPAWSGTDVVALKWSMSMEGVIAKDALPIMEEAVFSSASREVRMELAGAGTGAGTPNKRYSGMAHLKYTLKGERGDKWKVTLEGTGDGELFRASVATP